MARTGASPAVTATGLALTAILTGAMSLSIWPAGAAPGSSAAAAATVPRDRHVVVVLLDRTTPRMLGAVGAIQALDALGASGLMSTSNGPGAGGLAPLAAAATLSAGARAVGPPSGRGPDQAAPSATIVYPDVAAMERLNAAPTVAAAPGLLGQSLEDRGLGVAAIGNSDLPGDPFRPAAIVAMDRSGRVPSGVVATDKSTSGELLPLTVDERSVEDATTQALSRARLIVVDWGDTSRVDRLGDDLSARLQERDQFGATLAARLAGHRTASLDNLDTYLQFLQTHLRLQRDMVVLVSPSPPIADARRALNVAPIIVAGGGFTNGRLTSATTHRSGLVSNADLAPSILSWLGVAIPSAMVGHPMTANPRSFPLVSTAASLRRLERVADDRNAVLLASLALWLLAVATGLAVHERRLRALQRIPGADGDRRGAQIRSKASDHRSGSARPRPGAPDRPLMVARALILAVAVLPIVLLLHPLVPLGPAPVAVAEVVLTALGLGAAAAAMERRTIVRSLGWAGALTFGTILLDAVSGSHLAIGSLAGSRVARAPEYAHLSPILAGAAVAGAILAAAALSGRYRRRPRARRASATLAAVGLAALFPALLGGSAAAAAAGIPGVATDAALSEPERPSRRAVAIAGAALALGFVATAAVVVYQAAHHAAQIPAPGTVGTMTAAAAIVRTASASWLRFLLAGVWIAVISSALVVLVFLDRRTVRVATAARRGDAARPARSRGLQPADPRARAAMVALELAAALALVSGLRGPATAGVVLMAAALLAVATALDRTYQKV